MCLLGVSAHMLEIPRASRWSRRWSGCCTVESCACVKPYVTHGVGGLCSAADPGQPVESIGVCVYTSNTKKEKEESEEVCF